MPATGKPTPACLPLYKAFELSSPPAPTIAHREATRWHSTADMTGHSPLRPALQTMFGTAVGRRLGCSDSTMNSPGPTDRLYDATKLSAIVDVLAGQGILHREALRDIGVSIEALHAPGTLVSITQLLQACRTALRLSKDPHLPYVIGSSIHVSTYGMYGYAILCSTDFRRTMQFASGYHALAAPLGRITFSETDSDAGWTFDPIVHEATDARLYRFLVELQIGIFISLHRDVMGSSFTPSEIRLAYRKPDDFSITEDLVGCPVRFGGPANGMSFDRSWLDARPQFGNRTTYAAVEALCNDLISDLSLRIGVAGKVRTLLLQNIAHPPTLEAIAETLGTTTRTLRRQLQRQDTSFRELLDDMRSQVAMKYLRETAMTNEDIAFSLGFSDVTNFRHAFRRWTGKSPGEFRPPRPR